MTATISATKTESPAAAARRWLDAAGGRWQRPALIALLAATALLYFWDLSASGYANSFYAAAVQAGTRSWKAWLFGSLDSSNAITVDKPPAALWVMVLSCRIFGFHSWSLLAPQALEGVGAVWLTYATVRRWSGPAAGLLAGGALALTPVAVLMFKFDNPDALLVLLLCAAAYCTTRAVETANLRWLLLAGGALGFGFLTKMLQAFLILPGLALVYLIAAPTGIWRRVWQLLAGGLAIVVSAGWYVLLVQLWPASSRPYISGSTDNSLMQLALGYNGLQRLSGGGSGGAIRGGDGAGGGPKGVPSGTGHLVTPGGGGPGGGGGGFGGQTGIGRLFGSLFGTQVSWLLPAALLALVVGLVLTRKAPRTDRTRAALIMWGGWLLVSSAVFAYMGGIVHPYYSVALAPAIGALVGIGTMQLWRLRHTALARITLAVLIAGTGVWAYVLLDRTPDWAPALRYLTVIIALLGAAGVLIGGALLRRAAVVVVTVALLGAGLGTTAYAVQTTTTAHAGGIPTAGPAGQDGAGGFPGGGRRFNGGADKGPSGGAPGGAPGGGSGGRGPVVNGGPAGPGGAGGDQAISSDSKLAAMLKASTTRWAAATMGANLAESLELGTDGAPVMAIGGFSGGDPSPTLQQFIDDVHAGDIHYYIGNVGGDRGFGGGNSGGQNGGRAGNQSGDQGKGGGGFGGPGGRGANGDIANWVQQHYTSSTVDGYTVYDLTKPKS